MADSYLQQHEHTLFVKRVRLTSPYIFATCRCSDKWQGPIRDDRADVDRDFAAHRDGKTLPPAGSR